MSEEALALYREVDDQTGIAQTLNNLAAQMVQAGDLSAAEKKFQAALDIWRAMGSPDGVATALTNLGDARMALGEIAGAKSAYQESLETFRKNGENSKAAYPLVGMGDVYAASGDFASAKKSYEESLAISRETGEKHDPRSRWRIWARSRCSRETWPPPAGIFRKPSNYGMKSAKKAAQPKSLSCWPAC